MVMTSGVNFGIKKSLPLLFGICMGFTLMLLLVGLGIGQLFELLPELHLVIKCLGTLYLLYLAWKITKSNSLSSSEIQAVPFTFINGALFQWVNAKAWVVATGAIAAFTVIGADFYMQNLVLAATFLIISLPCVGTWLVFGTILRKLLSTQKHQVVFNYFMSILLVLAVAPVVLEITTQLSH